MLIARSETPRPRPPAKMRRQTSLTRLKVSAGRQVSVTSSPPPAYGTTYELGEPPELSDTLLGSPLPTTFKLMGYGRQRQRMELGEEDDDEWMNEKSKEELAGLLVKAEDIIKERENELGITSTVVKNLYENNVALKTKHEALLARLPPPTSSRGSSPDRVISRSSSLGYGSNLRESPSPPPPPPLYRGHARRVSVSTADISQLADQNAELMSKLEQLESESASADHAGRRELRRLEKEITALRQALEKTQAKSEELEEKTKGLDRGIDRAVEDAWKRKKEREQRMVEMRNGRHWQEEERPPVRDFAPRGSTFGGPSRNFSLSRSLSQIPVDADQEEGEGQEFGVMLPQPELQIMSRLLQKVQELEQTNARILHQQAETTNQLQAVQRDTEHITKVYECLADPQEVELEREMEGQFSTSTNSAKFGSFKRRIEADRLKGHGGKARKSVVGLFGEHAEPDLDLPAVPFASWWNDGRHRSSYSMGSPTLNFTSPEDDFLAELSPIGSRLTLEGELQGESTTWESEHQKSSWNLRSQSLSNISQLSMPSSPLALPDLDTKTPVVADFPRVEVPPPRTPPQPMPGTLPAGFGLSVEPPTPARQRVLHQQPSFDEQELSNLQVTRSPRHEFISQRIRARTARWEDGRFGSMSSTTSVWGSPSAGGPVFQPVFIPPPQSTGSPGSSRPVTPATPPRSMRISTIVDTLVDQFDGNLGGSGSSPEMDYEDAADYVSESYDEETGDEYGDDEDGGMEMDDDEETMVHRTPQFSEGNALQLHQTGEEKSSSQSKEGGAEVSTSGPGSGKWTSVLLELWLWLQFAVIIFVFLCAMAKRGPKAVLADAEQKTRTRKESMRLRRK